nr:putative metal-binding motif-containing protein [bacterium]
DDDTADDDTADDDTADDDTTDDDTADDDTADDDTADDDTTDDDTGDDDTSVSWVTCNRDGDLDGHGDPNMNDDFPVECPPGWLTMPLDDCDDTNPAVFPGAPEFPDDNVDQNCDEEEMTHSFDIGLYVSPDGDDGNSGSAEQPFKTIAHAVGGGHTTGKVVFAAAGVYHEQVDTQVSIFGGYNKDTWERDIEANETKITYSGGMYALRVYGADKEDIVRIQGLTIEHDGDGGESVAVIAQTGAWLARNTILSLSGADNSVGVNLAGGQYVLFANAIYGGPASSSSTGVVQQSDAEALYADNTIYGAGAGSPGVGVALNIAGYATIIGNTINAGAVNSFYSIGVNLTAVAATDDPVLVIANEIDGGTLSGMTLSATGVMIDETCATWLVNNVIDGGDGRLSTASPKTVGVYAEAETLMIANEIDGGLSANETDGVWLNADARLINNVIYGGLGTDNSNGVLAYEGSARLIHNVIKGTSAQIGSCALSQGVYVKQNAQGLLVNNIVYGGSGTDAYCVAPEGLSANVSLINNDLLFGAGGCAVYDGGCFTTMLTVNGCTWDNCAEAQGNISVEPQFAGGDDYHLTADSQCIDVGVDSRGWDATRWALYDIDGDLRPVGGWDLGLDEYVAPKILP